MFSGAHVILYSRDAEADRAFIQDKLGLAGVDAGEGWLIFKLPPAEVAVHPTDEQPAAEFYLMCDDVSAVMTRLRAEGVTCGPVTDQGWGLLGSIRLPSGADLAIYEPRHAVAYDLPG
jgi:catechol 2,3-dioxygenase-like lactoylglutathione lyase family enzyme